MINSDQEEAIAAQLVLNHGAAVTKLNGKDYFRHEGTSSKFIYGKNKPFFNSQPIMFHRSEENNSLLSVSDGSRLVQPESNTRLVNLNWLLESILQAKFLNLDKYPVHANQS